MKDSRVEFPGFQIYSHREDEVVFRRSMSKRLQKRAPIPLQIKPNTLISSSACNGGTQISTSSSSSTSTLSSFFKSNKDPIPLLSPLVVLESTSIREENTAKSH